MNNLFFELVRVSLSTLDDLSRTPSAQEWNILYANAGKQALLGVCFAGVQLLKKRGCESVKNLPQALLLQWLGMAVHIQQRNELMDKLSAGMWKKLDKAGLDAALLKGQGIALLYGDMAGLRQSGDIDMWVKGGFGKMNEYIQSTCPSEDFAYHRFHYNIYKGTEVELHFRPTLMRNLFDNRKLQRWCAECPDFVMTEKGFAVPPACFNRIFILTHIYRHFLFEGVGLRQIMDYFFVLKTDKANERENENDIRLLTDLRMKRFAEAVMWVLYECFGLDEDCLLCQPNEKEGRFLLAEIMQTGNFGQGDTRYKGSSKFKMMTRHNIHLLIHYPSEVVWTPIWLVYHKIWKSVKGRKINKIIRNE